MKCELFQQKPKWSDETFIAMHLEDQWTRNDSSQMFHFNSFTHRVLIEMVGHKSIWKMQLLRKLVDFPKRRIHEQQLWVESLIECFGKDLLKHCCIYSALGCWMAHCTHHSHDYQFQTSNLIVIWMNKFETYSAVLFRKVWLLPTLFCSRRGSNKMTMLLVSR